MNPNRSQNKALQPQPQASMYVLPLQKNIDHNNLQYQKYK